MSVLSDAQILKLYEEKKLIIEPFVKKSPPGRLSYGLSSFGYDLTLGRKFAFFKQNIDSYENKIDPKSFDRKTLCVESEFDHLYDYIWLEPKTFALAESKEQIKMPKNIIGICVGKSTYVRCGLEVPITPLEPEWEGVLTLELYNSTNNPIKLYLDEGICQIIFFEGSGECLTSYKDKLGKYQNQKGLTFPK